MERHLISDSNHFFLARPISIIFQTFHTLAKCGNATTIRPAPNGFHPQRVDRRIYENGIEYWLTLQVEMA